MEHDPLIDYLRLKNSNVEKLPPEMGIPWDSHKP